MYTYRRNFIKSSAAGLLAVNLVHGQSHAAQSTPLPIIDTHQHLWDLVGFKPPWLNGSDPRISAKHDMSDYLNETQNLNIVKAVYMEVDVAPEDQDKEADYVLSLIASKKTPTVAAVISGRPGLPTFAKYMERHRNNGLIKGVRQVLHPPSASKGLCLEPQFVKSVQLLGEMGKSFDLCMRPTELADGTSLAAKCPGTRFILDHCGNADPAAWNRKKDSSEAPGHTVDQWKRDIEALAKQSNVVCKISGIIARAVKGWTADDLAPAINFCLDQFGPNRVMFGGDWPVCKLGASYAQWVDALKQIVSSRPVEQQKKLFHDNAHAFYGLS